MVEVDRGRIKEPTSCAACRAAFGMQLVHNRSKFVDRQVPFLFRDLALSYLFARLYVFLYVCLFGCLLQNGVFRRMFGVLSLFGVIAHRVFCCNPRMEDSIEFS